MTLEPPMHEGSATVAAAILELGESGILIEQDRSTVSFYPARRPFAARLSPDLPVGTNGTVARIEFFEFATDCVAEI